jgi:hypothetical protein
MPCISSELKSVVLTLGSTTEGYGRVDFGKKGSQPSLGPAGWMKIERGTGTGAAGAAGAAARTGHPVANKKRNQTALRIFKNFMQEFMGFKKHSV